MRLLRIKTFLSFVFILLTSVLVVSCIMNNIDETLFPEYSSTNTSTAAYVKIKTPTLTPSNTASVTQTQQSTRIPGVIVESIESDNPEDNIYTHKSVYITSFMGKNEYAFSGEDLFTYSIGSTFLDLDNGVEEYSKGTDLEFFGRQGSGAFLVFDYDIDTYIFGSFSTPPTILECMEILPITKDLQIPLGDEDEYHCIKTNGNLFGWLHSEGNETKNDHIYFHFTYLLWEENTISSQFVPTSTALPIEVAYPAPTPITSLPTIDASQQYKYREIDGMVMALIPEGEFIMDFEDSTRTVFLDSYWIDIFEVSIGQYLRCVEAGFCTFPEDELFSKVRSWDSKEFLVNPKKYNSPMRYVTAVDAENYCNWVGGRLLTEAEWEKAARGTDGRTYPWGEEKPDSYQIDAFGDTHPKTIINGEFIDYSGASPYGVYHMAGSVWEWTDSWYNIGNNTKVIKGGSWNSFLNGTNSDFLKSSSRMYYPYDRYSSQIGFRCVID